MKNENHTITAIEQFVRGKNGDNLGPVAFAVIVNHKSQLIELQFQEINPPTSLYLTASEAIALANAIIRQASLL